MLDPEPHEIEIQYAGQTVEAAETVGTPYDERQKGRVSFQKTMEQDELFNAGTHDEILDVQFGLFAAEKLTAPDGSVIPEDGLIEILSVTGGEEQAFQTDLPFGGYYVREIQTHEQYVLSEKQYPVEFKYQGQDIALVEITLNDGQPIENKLIRGRIEGKKLSDDGQALQGARIGLYAPDTNEYTEETAIMTALSADDGSFSFADVLFGQYQCREISAPDGYMLSDNVNNIHITADGQLIEVEIVNKKIPVLPQTGDTSHSVLLWVLLILSGAGLAVITIIKKKQRED